jgi:hypothetical protein
VPQHLLPKILYQAPVEDIAWIEAAQGPQPDLLFDANKQFCLNSNGEVQMVLLVANYT